MYFLNRSLNSLNCCEAYREGRANAGFDGLLLYGLGESWLATIRFTQHSRLASFASSPEDALLPVPVSAIGRRGYVIFAGRRWQVVGLHPSRRSSKSFRPGGKPPLDGMGGKVHDKVRAEMRTVLSDAAPAPFLNQKATELLAEARSAYARLDLITRAKSSSEARVLRGTEIGSMTHWP